MQGGFILADRYGQVKGCEALQNCNKAAKQGRKLLSGDLGLTDYTVKANLR
jgi:hypothetical protein